MTEAELEQQIKDKGLTAARITPEQIDELIAATQYHRFPGTTTTVCAISLKNGFIAVGESGCVHPENFDTEIGRRIAFESARRKIWALEGYLLRERLNRIAGDGEPGAPVRAEGKA